MGSKRSKIGWFFWGVAWLFKVAFAVSAVVIPLMGVWIASSLAALHDGPLWLSLFVGALCFPLLPVAWDLWAARRRRLKGNTKPPVLTRFDRLLLRTLFINLTFVGGLLATFPQTVFAALSNRGDWMLDHVDAEWKDAPQRALFAAAESMAWFHEWTHPNEFESMVDRSYVRPELDDGDPQSGPSLRDLTESMAKLPEVTPESIRSAEGWPFRDEVHPLVRAIPANVETSYQSVAKYIAEREDDPIQRVKALHDYVADRVAYDAPALRAGHYPNQDAETVFAKRLGVCAGYANLLAAMGDAAGVEIVVVVGDTRDFEGSPWGTGHAWNAFRVDDHWYLMDATWNAGHVNTEFVREYGASFFMTPPEVFVLSHLPDDPKWQLLAEPVTRGEFLRRPDVRPNFYAMGFDMASPTEARVEARAGETMRVELGSEYGFEPQAVVFDGDDRQLDWCTRSDADGGSTITCEMPDTAGDYRIGLFGPKPNNDFMGRLYVTVR